VGESNLPISKTTRALGDLLRLSRAGKLHGLAYAIIKEDDDGSLDAGSNVMWNGDPRIGQALRDAVEKMGGRMDEAEPIKKPKSGLII